MTEEEAKTKWCPFARVTIEWQSHVASANRALVDNEKPLALCLGSACMAWRWSDVPNPEYAKHGGGQHFMQYPPPVLPPMFLKSESDGHCGLAGKP